MQNTVQAVVIHHTLQQFKSSPLGLNLVQAVSSPQHVVHRHHHTCSSKPLTTGCNDCCEVTTRSTKVGYLMYLGTMVVADIALF
jgi:hypothetical protein